jgi:enoyl-CoA hydratase/carnithine racemase
LAAGLVNYVYPPKEMLAKAVELAQQIAENPDWQLRKIKSLMQENYMERDLSLVVRHERDTFRESQGTEAHQEALLAFRERRKPNFHNFHKCEAAE